MTDNENEKGKGMIYVLLDRFNKQHYPRAMDLKEKVDAGEVFNESDQQFLEEVIRDLDRINTVVDQNPEYKELFAEILGLWNEIIEKSIENEKNTGNQEKS